MSASAFDGSHAEHAPSMAAPQGWGEQRFVQLRPYMTFRPKATSRPLSEAKRSTSCQRGMVRQ